MKLQQSDNKGILEFILVFFKVSVTYVALSIPINNLCGNNFFNISCFQSFPYGLSFGFPSFYYFYLIDHRYVLHGFTQYIIENLIVLLVGSTICHVIKNSCKILNYLSGISILVIVFYLASFLYCYTSF